MKITTGYENQLLNTVEALRSPGKGLLAMDESNTTCNRRFALYGIAQTAEKRRIYRELLIKTSGLSQYISGAILYDETIRQLTSDQISFILALKRSGIIPGIKVDLGTAALAGFPGEKITEGLDGMRNRLTEYAGMGLQFAKWRAVIQIADGMPSQACIHANTESLAQYAAHCQEIGILPIVEPEVLMEGAHTLDQCFSVTERVLHRLFEAMYRHQVDTESMILKPNMVLPGTLCAVQNTDEEIADMTLKCLLSCVPASVPGIAFLSGGQSEESASSRLNAMNGRLKELLPWTLTFSYSRALQSSALKIWGGQEKRISAAQDAILFRAKCNSEASLGQYEMSNEKQMNTDIS